MTLTIAIPLLYINLYLLGGIFTAELFKTHSARMYGPRSVGQRFGPYLAVVMLWAIIVPVAALTIVFGTTSRTKP